MHAFLFAAGRATRLGAAHANTPKILLPIGGRSLLDWHVGHLAALGYTRITVVSGHRREQIAAAFPALSKAYGAEVRELYNPDYGEGSVISVLTALPEIERSPGGALLLDGDVLYHRLLLERLVTSRHPTVLLIDREYATTDDDPVLVPLRRGQPFEFRKKWAGEADSVGESVGLFRIGADDVPHLARETRQRASGIARLDSYDEVIRVLVKAGRFGAEDITGLPWTEIDFPYDIEHAEARVLPALLEPAPAGAASSLL